MHADEHQRLRCHLADQARYIAKLAGWAKEHPDDEDVLLRVRDEVFTLRETLATLDVPQSLSTNEEWRLVPHPDHDERWPAASDAPG